MDEIGLENDRSLLQRWTLTLKFSEPEIIRSLENRMYKKRVMDMEDCMQELNYINTLTSDGRSFLLIGAEQGIILVFSLTNNKLHGFFRSDVWLNSVQYSLNKAFVVGKSREIQVYNIHSCKKIAAYPQIYDDEGYGSKGVKLCETSITNKIIANVGYGKFKIFDARSLKVIYTFDIEVDTLKEIKAEHRTLKPTVINHIVIKKLFKVVYLLEQDDHIYFYNYRFHKLVSKIRLFSIEDLAQKGTFLMTSMLLEQDKYLFVIVQFSKPVASVTPDGELESQSAKIQTILYVIHVHTQDGTRKIDLLFFSHLLSRFASPRKQGVLDIQKCGPVSTGDRGIPAHLPHGARKLHRQVDQLSCGH